MITTYSATFFSCSFIQTFSETDTVLCSLDYKIFNVKLLRFTPKLGGIQTTECGGGGWLQGAQQVFATMNIKEKRKENL